MSAHSRQYVTFDSAPLVRNGELRKRHYKHMRLYNRLVNCFIVYYSFRNIMFLKNPFIC